MGVHKMSKNLNEYGPMSEFREYGHVENNNIYGESLNVYFRDLKPHLINEIIHHDLVFGAVAWFTDFDILAALKITEGCSIVVQKEDFLRPDIDNANGWKSRLRAAYDEVPAGLMRHDFDNFVRELSYCGDEDIESFRCMGNYNQEKSPSNPRMHNKFMVFADQIGHKIVPKKVWTGSFNMSQNASNSLENAVLIQDELIAKAYFNEFSQILALSEPLDWENEWMEPEWRIGS